MIAMDMISFTQKVALITGASSGIGRSTAILFAKLGCRLSLIGRDEQRLKETVMECQKVSGTQHSPGKEPYIYVVADFVDLKQIDAAFAKTLSHFSQLDILINNAGCLPRDSIETMDMEQLDRTMKVNLYSAMHLTQLAVPSLTKTKGTVVNVSSVCGSRSFSGILSYCVSKAALDQFTKCVALELAPKGIRVNSVNPGVIVTPLQRRGGMSPEEYERFLDNSKTSHALGRPGEPEEVAQAIAFLASSASSFTTGHLLAVDGGRGVMCPR